MPSPRILLPKLEHLQLIPDGDADVLAHSRGEVTKSEAMDSRTFRPVLDGPGCERIFGALHRCGCGGEDALAAYRRDANGTRTCAACGAPEPRNERSERFGHLVLPAPLAHPLFVNDPAAPRLGVIPVLAPGLRSSTADVARPSGVSVRYVHLVNAIQRLRRYRDLTANTAVIEDAAANVEQKVHELFSAQLETWGSGGIAEYLCALDASAGRRDLSLREPGAEQPGILRLRGLALGLVSRVPEPARRVETHAVVLRATRSTAELLALVAGDQALGQLRCHVEERAVIVETIGLVVRVELIDDLDEVAAWSRKLGNERDHAVMVLRIEVMQDERYRGELWEATNATGRVFYRTPIEVVHLAKVFESIEGASIVDLRHAGLLHRA